MGGHPSLRSVPLRSFLPRQKKSADGKPIGLPFYCVDTVKPSAALRAMEGILRFAPFHSAFFLLAQKKSTHGIPDGLPSVALAKDGGRSRTRIYDLHDVNVAL